MFKHSSGLEIRTVCTYLHDINFIQDYLGINFYSALSVSKLHNLLLTYTIF